MQKGRNARYWNEFKVGEVIDTVGRTVESGDVSLFAGLSGRFQPRPSQRTACQEEPVRHAHRARTAYPAEERTSSLSYCGDAPSSSPFRDWFRCTD